MADSTVSRCRAGKQSIARRATAAILTLVPFALAAPGAIAQERAPPAGIVQPADPRGIDDVGTRREGSPIDPSASSLRPVQCGGVDLVQALRRSDPAAFETFENRARTVLNGQGLLWRVERQGGRVSYLFGTMHSSEAVAKTFDELVFRALKRARTVATELPGASSRRVAAELRRLVASRSYRPQGHSLSLLPDDIRPEVQRRIAQAGIPPAVADQLEPWYLALALSRSNCAPPPVGPDTETADARIERLGVEQGSSLMGLETPLEQVEALASIPDHVALRMIKDSAVSGLKPEDVESTITGLYSTRRIGYLLAMRGPAWTGVFDVDGYAEFISAFITRRNSTMLDRALPILAVGDAFIAVGALHLPGEQGLVELIRRAGYAVTRIW